MARHSIFSSPAKSERCFVARLTVAGLFCVSLGATAFAESDRWTRCRAADAVTRITGCTEIIARGNRETKRSRIAAFISRSGAYRVKGDFDRAIADLDKALQLAPKSASALLDRASIHQARGDLDRAIADYDKGLQVDPKVAAAYSGRAKAYRDKSDLDKALADFDEAVELDPESVSFRLDRAALHLARDDFDQAIADYTIVVERAPRLAEALLGRASAYRGKQDIERAKQDLEAALKLDPNLTSAKKALEDVDELIAKGAAPPAAPTSPPRPPATPPGGRQERPSPLASTVLFSVGPVSITQPVVTTWAIMLVLTIFSWLGTRRLRQRADRRGAVLEVVVTGIMGQIEDVIRTDPRPFLPLLGTLFIFLATANLSGLLPGAEAPTSKLETPAALALVVFVSVHYFGVRTQGPLGYLASFAKPKLIMLPLNIVSQVTRTFSLMVRLFGNVMSGEFTIALVVALAGLFVPIPLMALEVLVGLVQAYIFTVLSTVFIGAAIGSIEQG
ncbi:F0F1 ATP synthase subunit A [Methylosinus sp. LW3]|uniref:F0F1 ATP synthase subunit A n=1 Tax=Methylosinus sp. LW3 TaxID=107635 RepID=UPI000462FA34